VCDIYIYIYIYNIGDKKDFEAGAALFGVAASPAGAVLPRLDQLSRRGRDR